MNLRDLGIEPPSVAGVVKVANRFRLEFEIHAGPESRARPLARLGVYGRPARQSQWAAARSMTKGTSSASSKRSRTSASAASATRPR